MLVPVHPHPAVISAWANALVVARGMVKLHKRIIPRRPVLLRDFEMRITYSSAKFLSFTLESDLASDSRD
jgi:hypothetical protein